MNTVLTTERALRNQARRIYEAHDPRALHRWLCHPSYDCKSGCCDVTPIVARVQAYLFFDRPTADEALARLEAG